MCDENFVFEHEDSVAQMVVMDCNEIEIDD